MTKHPITRSMTPQNHHDVRIAVVVLNWRAPAMTLRAIERAFGQTREPDHIFVVENGSGDDSETVLRAGLAPYGDRCTLLSNYDNLGFGGGCNTALRCILDQDYDFCWLLNNDAVPSPTCLAELCDTATRTSLIGAVGSLLFDPAKPGADHYGSRLNPVTLISHSLGSLDDVESYRYGWLTAASLLVCVSALRHVGIFDERYFMYWEDADLSMRLRAAGYSLVAEPKARVAHVAGTSSQDMITRRYQWHLASQRLWLRKHHPLGVIMAPVISAKYLLKALIDRDLSRFRALLSS